jgi:TolB-like protein
VVNFFDWIKDSRQADGGDLKMNMRKGWIISGALLLLSVFAGLALAGQVVTDFHRNWAKGLVTKEKTLGGTPSPESLAVLYFVNQTGVSALDPVQKGLTFMLITDLSKVEGIQLVERAKLQALVEEIGLGKSGLVDPNTAPRVGHLLGVEHVVGGNFRNAELEKFGIDTGILHTGDEYLADLPDSKGFLNEIFRMEKDVLFEILEYLKKSPKMMAMAEILRTPMTTSLEALIFLFKGLNESDQGNYQMASDFYRRALKADPELTAAADALKELSFLGLLDETGNSSASFSGGVPAHSPEGVAPGRFPERERWRDDYLAALLKGKAVQLQSDHPAAAGLAYTPPEVVVLQEAISKALEKEKGTRRCECMKIAIEADYNAYLVIKTIYEVGGNLEIDQLCMCATEAGVMRAIIAKAAREAASPLGGSVYSPDEVARANCFRGEEGLAYTPGDVVLAVIPVDTRDRNNIVSIAAPQ